MGTIPENGTAEDEASAKYNLVALKQVFFIQDLIDLNPFLSILMFLVQRFTPQGLAFCCRTRTMLWELTGWNVWGVGILMLKGILAALCLISPTVGFDMFSQVCLKQWKTLTISCPICWFYSTISQRLRRVNRQAKWAKRHRQWAKKRQADFDSIHPHCLLESIMYYTEHLSIPSMGILGMKIVAGVHYQFKGCLQSAASWSFSIGHYCPGGSGLVGV